MDYENPTLYRPYRHKQEQYEIPSSAPISVQIILHFIFRDPVPEWAHADQRPTCFLRYQTNRNAAFSVGLQELLGFDYSQSGNEDRIVVGTKGSKVELIEYANFPFLSFLSLPPKTPSILTEKLNRPDKFFKSVLLKSEPARFWLVSGSNPVSQSPLSPLWP